MKPTRCRARVNPLSVPAARYGVIDSLDLWTLAPQLRFEEQRAALVGLDQCLKPLPKAPCCKKYEGILSVRCGALPESRAGALIMDRPLSLTRMNWGHEPNRHER